MRVIQSEKKVSPFFDAINDVINLCIESYYTFHFFF